MSVLLIEEEFQRVGKREAGTEAEKYKAKQLKENIASADTDSFLTDVIEVSGGDLKVAAEMFTRGANNYLRLLAGEYDEASKAARALYKMGVTFGTSDVADLANAIREGRLKVA